MNTNGNEDFKEIIQNRECVFPQTYINDINNKTFKFLPGHASIIVGVSEKFSKAADLREQKLQTNFANILDQINSFEPALPNILKELFQTALSNSQVTDNLNRYPDTLKYFAMYIYLLCGRQCYEVLCSNLAMPAASTIGKHLQFIQCCLNSFNLNLIFMPYSKTYQSK